MTKSDGLLREIGYADDELNRVLVDGNPNDIYLAELGLRAAVDELKEWASRRAARRVADLTEHHD